VRVTTIFPGRTDTPMQQKVHEHEKKVYDVEQLMRPETVARAILHVVDLPADSTIQDLTIRPMPHSRVEPQGETILVNPQDLGTPGAAGDSLGDALERDSGLAATLR
jgi:NAD(P)-dependent dehydrogenase (short-subunit alcohol dehydrogenase family)